VYMAHARFFTNSYFSDGSIRPRADIPLSSANSILLLEGPDLSDLVVLVEEEDLHRVPFIVAIR
jgi:hypothetical protein